MRKKSSRVTWHMVEERVCKDCGYVFYPKYEGQFMTCFCSDPVHVDWTQHYVRIVGDADKILETGKKFPCCISLKLTDWQREIRSKMILGETPATPTEQDYSNYYKENIEGKK